MTPISRLLLLFIPAFLALLIPSHAQRISPILPSDFVTIKSAGGQPIVSNAGASGGVHKSQLQGIPYSPVSGAANKVLPHPTNANILYIGSTNGGIWKSTNALADPPTWIPLTDHMPSMTIGALSFDYSDPTYNTILAAFGSKSSFYKLGGFHVGIIKTKDGGNTWTNFGSQALYGQRLQGVIGNGDLISVCSIGLGYDVPKMYQNGGTFLSQDGGITWSKVNNDSCADMVSEKSMPMTLYRGSLQKGVVVSRDGGKTWDESALPNYPSRFNETIINIRLSVRNFGDSRNPDIVTNVIASSKVVQGILQGENKGAGQSWAWTNVDLPRTYDNGTWNGLHVGSQGDIHMSITGDPIFRELLYVAGDRQPTGPNGTWPNGIGATTYGGRVFKCNISLPVGEQCIPLTHAFAFNFSAPHADSRDMAFDASGRLMQGDDGGIYYRMEPRSTSGRWGSACGNLQLLESHAATYVGSNTFVTGNQDAGTTFGKGGDGSVWEAIGPGDGAVCRAGHPPGSNDYELYFSWQYFGDFSSTTFKDGQHGEVIPKELRVIGTNHSLTNWTSSSKSPVAFYQNYCVNRFDSKRLFIGINFDDFIFESFDGGNTVIQYSINPTATGQKGNSACVYGGIIDGISVPDATYFVGKDQVARRTGKNSKFTITSWPPAGTYWADVVDVSALSSNWNIVVVLGLYGDIGISHNAGDSFELLPPLRLGVAGKADAVQRRIMILEGSGGNLNILVCGRGGVYALRVGETVWTRLSGMPNAYAYDIGFDPIDDMLWISTIGRNVWKVSTASTTIDQAISSHIQVPSNPAERPSFKQPDYKKLTYIFAAFTIVLFAATLTLGIVLATAFFQNRKQSKHDWVMETQPFIST